MAYAVAQRTREIAIRTALGATAREVVQLVLLKALRLAAAGITGGLVLTILSSRAFAGLLFGVTPTDAPTYAIVAFLLTAVALIAAAIPVSRATRIDGAQVLRS
jgi:putative ABC transport system permease protein